MKEINDIIRAYHKALQNNQSMALATVVKVEGSSYRQPGARMLVTEDGELTGAISGGCLEGDALRKALLAIHQRTNKLITYDTTSAENAEFGVQLGCNGIVHILFEYIQVDNPSHPIILLKELQQTRMEAIMVTLFSTIHRHNQPGTLMVAAGEKVVVSTQFSIDEHEFLDDIKNVKYNKNSHLKELNYQNKQFEALFEYINPSVHLVVVGAGNDAQPLIEIADILGWETTVIDGRTTHALPHRFPKAKQVLRMAAHQVAEAVKIDASTVFVLMTHNYQYDMEVLKSLDGTLTPYIGVLGPKTRLHRMFNELMQIGTLLSESQQQKIHGPMGLDIGAETAEEIALSVVSEIKAFLAERSGSSLKFLTDKIHNDIPTIS